MERIVLPSSDLSFGLSISEFLKFLMESQWWTREQMDEYQNKKLRELIKHSYENIPYYNELFKKLKLTPNDIKSKDDLYKIPILTKEEVRKNFPDKMIATNIPSSKRIMGSSSGSTGEPLKYFDTKRSLSLQQAAGIRAWYWMNYKLGDKYIKISKHPRNSRIKRIQDLLNNCNYIYFEKLTEKTFLELIEKIESIDPKIIRCYPIPLYYMAEIIEKRGGIKLKNLKAINTTASTLHPYMRRKIQKVFNTKIYDSYSCEGGSVFSQCETLENYHPSEECAISEFIEDDFSRNDPDKSKRHITTYLFNYVNSFIRYDTQDYLVLGDEKQCGCGRNYINVSGIKGRDNSILYLPNGNYLMEMDFFQYFDESNEVDQFQIIQEKRDIIQMKLVVNDNFNNMVKKEILNYWSDFFGSSVKFSLEIVENIELTPSGKRRFLIRNPEIKIFECN